MSKSEVKFTIRDRRTLSDVLRDEENEKEARRERIKWGHTDPSVKERDISYDPIGDGSGRRKPVRYE